MVNIFDKVSSLMAELVVKVFPANKREKSAFYYYLAGSVAQNKGQYRIALDNYLEAMELEEDPYDMSYIYYNMGILYNNIGAQWMALDLYHAALNLNSNLPQALNNIAVIYHSLALDILEDNQDDLADKLLYKNLFYLDNDLYNKEELAEQLFNKAAEYWQKALKLAPYKYPGAQNWLKTTGRLTNLNDYI